MENKKNSGCIDSFILTSFFFIVIFSSYTIVGTSNWKSSGGANGSDDDKQHVNFYGTLTTHQGQKDAVNNILVEGKHKGIIMYDAPVTHSQEIFNQRTKQTEIKLDKNPVNDFGKAEIDLNAISSLKVSKPDLVWVYQKEKRYQRIEFIGVEITYKESSEVKKYLLERKMYISCNAVNNGAQKKQVPLAAIDTLTIEGYSFTLNASEARKNRPAPCVTKTSP